MNVIEADSSHVGYLSEFGRKSFLCAYRSALPLEELDKYINVAFSEATIREELNDSLATYFICQDSRMNPCGYAKLIQSPPPACINENSCVELQRLYVDSDYRGHGIGKLLELHAEAYAESRNTREIWLRVWEGNEAAQDIYGRWGFSVVGNEPYRVGDDQRTVLLMRKSLSGG